MAALRLPFLLICLAWRRCDSHVNMARPAWCPEPWEQSQCLGTSGALAGGEEAEYNQTSERVKWKDGMAGHTHYTIDPQKTALFVIDPQEVYAKCPTSGAPFTVPDLIAGPGSKDFDGHSPLCCEGFYAAVGNASRLAKRARESNLPVFVMGHIYRDFDGDGQVDNCGRLCDFDVLGWTGWPMAWNLWNEALPWHSLVYGSDGREGDDGVVFFADFSNDFYAEKTTYSAMTRIVVKKLKQLGVDTIIITGFMTQYCSVTTARHAHDLGFRVIYVSDACDGPILAQLLSGVDENAIVPFHLGIAVVDVTTTEELLDLLPGGTRGGKDEL